MLLINLQEDIEMEALKTISIAMVTVSLGLIGWTIYFLVIAMLAFVIDKVTCFIGKIVAKFRKPKIVQETE